MLTRRTNLLLTEQDYWMLSALTKKKGVSMGELIRTATRKVYGGGVVDARTELLAKMGQLAKKAKTKGIDYKKLVEDGRKY
ncbi:hypothetical protein KJ909_01965 [Patescibacteria group bacterium]|nr:hypothetical protein [Patescibacteria group bacterium]